MNLHKNMDALRQIHSYQQQFHSLSLVCKTLAKEITMPTQRNTQITDTHGQRLRERPREEGERI